MMKILFGHGRWDVSYDRDYSTDDKVEWTNVSSEDILVNLIYVDSPLTETFVIEAGKSFTGSVGSVLRIALC